MFNYKLLKRLAIVLLIAVFSIGFISCKNRPTDPSESQASEGITDNPGTDNPGTDNPGTDNPGQQPTKPEDTTFPEWSYRAIMVPYSGAGPITGKFGEVTAASYMDTNTLNQLWFDQINRKGTNDGKVFAIRNRANDRSMNDFQDPIDGRLDYYYFAANGDIYYKGGDKNIKTGETLIKKFVGAVIVDTRRVVRRSRDSDTKADDVIAINNNQQTVGGVYRMAISKESARMRFADMTGPTDGVYEFIAARRRIYTFYTSTVQESYWFVREFDTSNLEVLVLSKDANEGNEGCLGIHSYYEYYTSPNGPMKFTEDMIGTAAASPEFFRTVLNQTTTFTDGSRWWSFLAMPGHPETGTTARASGRLPRL